MRSLIRFAEHQYVWLRCATSHSTSAVFSAGLGFSRNFRFSRGWSWLLRASRKRWGRSSTGCGWSKVAPSSKFWIITPSVPALRNFRTPQKGVGNSDTLRAGGVAFSEAMPQHCHCPGQLWRRLGLGFRLGQFRKYFRNWLLALGCRPVPSTVPPPFALQVRCRLCKSFVGCEDCSYP